MTVPAYTKRKIPHKLQSASAAGRFRYRRAAVEKASNKRNDVLIGSFVVTCTPTVRPWRSICIGHLTGVHNICIAAATTAIPMSHRLGPRRSSLSPSLRVPAACPSPRLFSPTLFLVVPRSPSARSPSHPSAPLHRAFSPSLSLFATSTSLSARFYPLRLRLTLSPASSRTRESISTLLPARVKWVGPEKQRRGGLWRECQRAGAGHPYLNKQQGWRINERGRTGRHLWLPPNPGHQTEQRSTENPRT